MKRSCCDDLVDRRRLGQKAKKLRAHADDSRREIEKTQLATWDRSLAKWYNQLQEIRASSRALEEALKELPAKNVFQLKQDQAELVANATCLLEKISRVLDLLHEGVIHDMESQIHTFIAGDCSDVSIADGDKLMWKMRWFSQDVLLPPQYAEYVAARRPNALECSDDESQERDFWNLFERAEAAIDDELASTSPPFSQKDSVRLANFFLAELSRVRSAAAAFEGPIDVDRPCSASTRAQAQFIQNKLLARDFASLIPWSQCSTCLDAKQNVEKCQNCGLRLCADCFEVRMQHEESIGWSDPATISCIALSKCAFCTTGSYGERMTRLLSPGALRLYKKAIHLHGAMRAQHEAMLENKRSMAQFRELSCAEEMLYFSARAACIDLVSLRKPCCSELFADYDGCCAVECSECTSYFCCLCLQGGMTNAVAHRHVATCAGRPAEMDGIFLPIQAWKRHVARQQHARVSDWLFSKDLPQTVTARVLRHFQNPDDEE